MKAFIDEFKTKKDLQKNLRVYSEFVQKKLSEGELNSALDKVRSAITVIKEHEDKFDITKELAEFEELNNKIIAEINKTREAYSKRYNNLLKEKVDETNLESLMKLLAMLKNDVDKVKNNVRDISENINKYFEFIKRLYVILSAYKTINYYEVVEKVFQFIKDLETENIPNLANFIQSIYHKLVNRRLFELSKQYEKILLSDLMEKMAMQEGELIDFIVLVIGQENSPIKVYNSTTKEIIFKREK